MDTRTNSSNLLIPFFSAGYPQLNDTQELLGIFDGLGCQYIEVGLPHSDALADGPTIQRSSQQALSNSMNIQTLISQVSSASVSQSKLILFSYFNPVVVYGIERTCQEWKAAGGHSILIPDLPIEESEQVDAICREYNLSLIYLVAPTSTPERVSQIVQASTEFIYLVSVTGITGTSSSGSLDQSLMDTIQNIKSIKPDMKVVIGFGISSGEKAQNAIKLGADGVVIGSAIVQMLEQGIEHQSLSSFIGEIQDAISH